MALEVARIPLPMTLDEVTPEWLTEALSRRFPGVEVVDTVRDAERAGTSTSARFALTYGDDGGHADLPAAVYVKGGFDPVMRRRVWAALIQEARFFAELAPEVPVDVPLAYFVGADEEARQGVVVLEDMTARGVRFGQNTEYLPLDSAARLMEELSGLHARFWNSPRLEAYRGWGEPQRTYLRYLCRQKHWDEVLERPYGDQLRQIFPTPDAALAALERMWAIDDTTTPTLLHGDCHGGNLFFAADGRPGFLDWQCVFPGAPAHDLGELLLSSLDTEDRRRGERDLLATYREGLLRNGVDSAPSVDELLLAYRQNIMHNMASAVLNPYDMQTVEVTNLTAGRTLQAAVDLDLLDALKA